MIVNVDAYSKKGRNLLKVRGNDPKISANTQKKTSTIAACTKYFSICNLKPIILLTLLNFCWLRDQLHH